jgi:hypothetical protein
MVFAVQPRCMTTTRITWPEWLEPGSSPWYQLSFECLLATARSVSFPSWPLRDLGVLEPDDPPWAAFSHHSLPTWLSLKLSGLSGLNPDSLPWLSHKVPLSPPYINLYNGLCFLYFLHWSHCAFLIFGCYLTLFRQFYYCPIIIIAVFLILDMSWRYFDPVTGKPVTTTAQRISKHHKTQNTIQYCTKFIIFPIYLITVILWCSGFHYGIEESDFRDVWFLWWPWWLRCPKCFAPSPRRPSREYKRMVLELTHGLFIT